MSLLALILGAVLSGSTIVEYGKQPLDEGLVEQVSTQQEQPFLEGYSSWYDYQLQGNRWSKTHDTCAMRDKEHRYQTFKVCAGDKCVECKLNDYGPSRDDRVIDLSSHAFKQLAPLSRGLVYVKVYLVED